MTNNRSMLPTHCEFNHVYPTIKFKHRQQQQQLTCGTKGQVNEDVCVVGRTTLPNLPIPYEKKYELSNSNQESVKSETVMSMMTYQNALISIRQTFKKQLHLILPAAELFSSDMLQMNLPFAKTTSPYPNHVEEKRTSRSSPWQRQVASDGFVVSQMMKRNSTRQLNINGIDNQLNDGLTNSLRLAVAGSNEPLHKSRIIKNLYNKSSVSDQLANQKQTIDKRVQKSTGSDLSTDSKALIHQPISPSGSDCDHDVNFDPHNMCYTVTSKGITMDAIAKNKVNAKRDLTNTSRTRPWSTVNSETTTVHEEAVMKSSVSATNNSRKCSPTVMESTEIVKKVSTVNHSNFYQDPLPGASANFQQRLSELASLEQETLRQERLRFARRKRSMKAEVT